MKHDEKTLSLDTVGWKRSRTGSGSHADRRAGQTILVMSGLAFLGCSYASSAQADWQLDSRGLRADFGQTELRGRFSASVQAALIEPLETGDPSSGDRFDMSARFTLRHTTEDARQLGVVAELDRDVDEPGSIAVDELFVFLSSDRGRLEFGENDGAADQLSYHAPTTGLNQVRGDFSRYAGYQALLSPYDSRDAVKLTWLSPPGNGLRAGLSYAPEFVINDDAQDMGDRLEQEHVVEAGVQYTVTIDNTVLGFSAALVRGTSVNPEQWGDIDSAGAGAQVTQGRWRIGAGYVDRNRSNLRLDEEPRTEWNAGIEYRDKSWSVAASVALDDERAGTVNRYGIGGTRKWTENAYMAIDLVRFVERTTDRASTAATIGLLEFGLRF